MNRIALAAAALAMAVAPAAFAADTTSNPAPAPTMQNNQDNQDNMNAPATMKTAPHAIHYRSRKSAAPLAVDRRTMSDSSARRETRAMNLIGAAGYNNFSNIKPDGRNFTATAMKGDQRVSVLVDPDNGKVTPQ